MEHHHSKGNPRNAAILPDKMISRRQHVPVVSARQGVVAPRKGTWVTGVLFWFFFIIDVFAACYWPISQAGALLTQSKLLSLHTARVTVLLASAVLTPAMILGIISLLKPETKDREGWQFHQYRKS